MVKNFDPTNFKPPSSFPAAFLNAVRAAPEEFVIAWKDLPWEQKSALNHWDNFIASLRASPGHELHLIAVSFIWGKEELPSFLVIQPRIPKNLSKRIDNPSALR